MMRTTIEENWKDYTSHSCTIEIPQSFGKLPEVIEVRRSMLQDNAFMLIRDGIPIRVIPQMQIWKTIMEISQEMFRAFGIYEPVIGWVKKGSDLKLGVDGEGNFVKTE